MNYYEIFSNILSENQIKVNEPMSKHTTFGIGGIADCFVQPETVSQLQQVVKILKKYNSPIFILGGGANLLVRDKGIRGVVISTVGLKNIECKGNKISVNSGVTIAKVAHFAAKNGLSGMEELSGIPGSIGGGVFMNAGAYGGEMSHIVENVTTCDFDGNLKEYSNFEIDYNYRHSVFMDNGDIIVNVTLTLKNGNINEIKQKINEYNSRRREKQPLDKRSAGSTFKRPKGHFVGKMIEELGLKGFSVGDAKVSTKHAGFLINDGNASCEDMLALIGEIQRRVKETYKVDLYTEVQVIGEA